MISPEKAQERVEFIRSRANDDEVAHSTEDDLRHQILEAIANGSPHAQRLARIALETSDIEFARWCA